MTARGLFVLNDVEFTSDPRTYEMQWPRRASQHATIGGGVTIQDFGRGVQDLVLHLADDGNMIEDDVAFALDAMFAQTGVAFTFTDWHGTSGTAFIHALELKETGLRGWWGYDMTLWVRSLDTLYGVPYTGA